MVDPGVDAGVEGVDEEVAMVRRLRVQGEVHAS